MRRHSKSTTKRTKIRLSPKETQDVIEKEFGDSKGNKTIIRLDFRPHSIKEPTIQLDYEYSKDNK